MQVARHSLGGMRQRPCCESGNENASPNASCKGTDVRPKSSKSMIAAPCGVIIKLFKEKSPCCQTLGTGAEEAVAIAATTALTISRGTLGPSAIRRRSCSDNAQLTLTS